MPHRNLHLLIYELNLTVPLLDQKVKINLSVFSLPFSFNTCEKRILDSSISNALRKIMCWVFANEFPFPNKNDLKFYRLPIVLIDHRWVVAPLPFSKAQFNTFL